VCVVAAPLDPVLAACQWRPDMQVAWSLPPPDPSRSAQALALCATEMLI
jgi:hypothetical protein